MTIGEMLQNARLSREKRLADVAEDLKIPLTTIHAWERDASYPRGKRRDQVEEYYGFPKGALDYPKIDPSTGAREFNVQYATQSAGMADYETKQIVLHKKYWEMAEKSRAKAGDVDFNEMFTRLLKAENK